ncbi:MAG: rod-binding protein [Desulfovibrio sp.]|nr:rod-binding protein [Desulfovibrio sp.]
MSSPYIAPEASFSEQSRTSMQSRLDGLGGLAGQNMTPEAKAKKLREACEGFESIFIQKMWQEMRNSVPKGGLLQGREERFWQDMYDQELAKSMTKAGGIGLADMMYEQLSANLGDASKTAAGRGTFSAFAPEAAPLMGSSLPADKSILDPEEEPAPVADMSIYEGDAPATAGAPEVAAVENPVVQTPVVAPQPVNPAPATAEATEKPVRKSPERVKKTGHEGDSALNLAYLARREAGDKLGSRAVRPALQPKKAPKVEPAAEAAQPVAAAAPNPGSEAALRSAVEMAKSGGVSDATTASRSMQDLVTSVKLENARIAAQNAAPQAAPIQANAPVAETEAVAAAEGPVTRKVTVSTNIPRNQKTGKNKKTGDAIRMLNVDNVSANSKAGQGLAAYKAAQSQGAPQPAVQPTAAAPVPPLTVADNSEQPTFSIPPLTGADAAK